VAILTLLLELLPVRQRVDLRVELIGPAVLLGERVDTAVAVETARMTEHRQHLFEGLDGLHLFTDRNRAGRAREEWADAEEHEGETQ
jgi:hypothetical protein